MAAVSDTTRDNGSIRLARREVGAEESWDVVVVELVAVCAWSMVGADSVDWWSIVSGPWRITSHPDLFGDIPVAVAVTRYASESMD